MTLSGDAPSVPHEGILDWLLSGDPAIRWQVMRDLTGAPTDEVAQERSRVAAEGWGARLLAEQDGDGLWAGALYSPKWTSTTYTLLLLHWLGLPPGNEQALTGCRRLWEGARFYGGGLNLAKTVREPETCITSMLVLLAASSGHEEPRLDDTVAWLLGEQLDDGGWNCESIRTGSRHGSLHTTISALDALLVYQRTVGTIPVDDALRGGQGFLLQHSMYRSHRTGCIVDASLTRFPFPPQWHYDVLRGLEHFRAAGAARDDRLADAIGILGAARRADGTWPVHRAHPGRVWFRMEEPGPSRWATLRCLRVLAWWGESPG
ncbi:hypothetical protein [Nocardioides sp.]|uniref:hypothetical protein n=1 Tax=Nocardioides sp. TaxID=35761 RepID=UPI0027360519|nr:hypothetical protein [Nocardioides sp.]MDP3892855.1 hypothetical protein [Nocardioides sp.]